MKGPAVPASLQQALSKLHQQGSDNEELHELGNTLKRMFEKKRLTRMWIDSVTNHVHCE